MYVLISCNFTGKNIVSLYISVKEMFFFTVYECLAGPLPGSPRSWFFLIVVLYVLLDRCHLRDLRMTGCGPLSRSGGTANIVHSVCCSWNQVSGRMTENTCWGFNHSAFWLWAKLLWSVSVTARYLASYTWYLRSCTCSLMLPFSSRMITDLC